MSAIIYWQNPCKLPMSFRCVKAFMHAFSGRFSRASLEGISFNFFVCFILNVSIGSAPKRKNIDIQRNTRVGLGCQFTSKLLSCHHIWWIFMTVKQMWWTSIVHIWLESRIQYVCTSYMVDIHLIHKWWTSIIFINDGHPQHMTSIIRDWHPTDWTFTVQQANTGT